MSFDWSEYFHVAQELVEQSKKSPHQDAMLRSAISRAYYAAFGKARDHLRFKDKLVEPRDEKGHRGNAHAYVIETFKNSSDAERAAIGVNLERMRIARNQADYEGRFNTTLAPFTKFNLALAKDTLARLRKL